ncbi:hypothetical protein pah_c045o065 [Parachlamydia acanthamoebae str. Hall's coccus]|nr:hypothetical protein pah_c045o065 [Parachlamydia acanthamoebae str. Hall's coccus]
MLFTAFLNLSLRFGLVCFLSLTSLCKNLSFLYTYSMSS